jgi:hypothetical protein
MPTEVERDHGPRRGRCARATLLAVVGLALLAAAPAGAVRPPVTALPASATSQIQVPADVSGTVPVQVTAGGGHSCAIKPDGTIVCWGSNSDGQATPPPGTFKAVDAGGLHTCAIRTDDTVACWGKNDDGESTAPPGTFSAVSAGGDHSCGLRTDHTLACWGRNTQSPPFNVAPAGSYLSVSAGNTAGATWSCAVGVDHTITCWGYNAYGRGNPPPGMFSVAEAGATYGCALSLDSAMACWGGFSWNGSPVPTPAAGIFTAISGGYDFACGLRNDQTLYCHGDDAAGRATPPAGTFRSLSAGYSHACGVRTNGAVACWGSNGFAQISPIPASLTQPTAEVTPATLAFGAQPKSTVSAPKMVSVTNRGAADLQILGESFAGPAADDFFVGASTCHGPLPAGQTCALWVRFAPQGEASRIATLTLATNASPVSYAVALSGAVVAPGTGASCTVPKLAGKTLAAAKSALARGNCTLGHVKNVYSSTVKKRHVVKSSPTAGSVLAQGAKVNLVLSRGKRG